MRRPGRRSVRHGASRARGGELALDRGAQSVAVVDDEEPAARHERGDQFRRRPRVLVEIRRHQRASAAPDRLQPQPIDLQTRPADDIATAQIDVDRTIWMAGPHARHDHGRGPEMGADPGESNGEERDGVVVNPDRRERNLQAGVECRRVQRGARVGRRRSHRAARDIGPRPHFGHAAKHRPEVEPAPGHPRIDLLAAARSPTGDLVPTRVVPGCATGPRGRLGVQRPVMRRQRCRARVARPAGQRQRQPAILTRGRDQLDAAGLGVEQQGLDELDLCQHGGLPAELACRLERQDKPQRPGRHDRAAHAVVGEVRQLLQVEVHLPERHAGLQRRADGRSE